MLMSEPIDPRTAEPQPPFAPQTQRAPGSEERMDPKPDWGYESYVGHGRLEGRVALVTGGDSGIGRAVALAYAREGADVAISYLDEHEDAGIVKRAVEEAGREALLLPGDLANADICRNVVEETVERFGRIDVLVNNAAFQGRQLDNGIEDLDDERLRRTFEVNILAFFRLVRAALPHMQAGGTIINCGSVQAYDPAYIILDYATTKGAIVTFTKGLARQLMQRGIRVNCVAPGAFWTPLIPSSFDAESTATHGKGNLLGRAGQPAEIAPAFVFLASDESRFVTGEVLGVTGGDPLLP